MEWVKDFYKKQFVLINDYLFVPPANLYIEDAVKIEEQYGKSFQTVLELGAGNGELTNAFANKGKDVTSIELVPEMVEFATKYATVDATRICADFYDVALAKTFDTVLYIDGFGIGEDEDQLRLLTRIASWLNEDGYGLIDIYEPNYWRQTYKEKLALNKESTVFRQYNFDEKTNRFTDTWWHIEAPQAKTVQSLKCYTYREIQALCDQANLQIVAYFPNGAMDFVTWTYTEVAPLDNCISYRIKVKRK
jgi:predicted RNA methylase